MSLNGTGTPKPSLYCAETRETTGAHAASVEAKDWFGPDGRKKLRSAGETHGPEGPTAQGIVGVPACSGLETVGCALAMAQELNLSQFSIIAFGFVGFALIGRFR